MDAIEFRETELALIEKAFGGLSMSELTIPYNELGEYEIQLDMSGDVSLDDLVTGRNGEGSRLNLSVFPGAEAKIQRVEGPSTKDPSEDEAATEVELESRPKSIPPVPEVTSFKDDTRERFYKRLKNNPDSQPAIIRRVIRNEGEMTKRQLASWMKRHGYEPSAGSFNECLLVLDEVTNDIDRHGRGNNQRLVWAGE
jgi:hypothetical protein